MQPDVVVLMNVTSRPFTASFACLQQLAEERTAYDRSGEMRRADLKRQRTTRLQEFDLLTATSGLDLERIVEATEPAAAPQQSGGPSITAVPRNSQPVAGKDSPVTRREPAVSSSSSLSRSDVNLASAPYAPAYKKIDTSRPESAAVAQKESAAATAAMSRSDWNVSSTLPSVGQGVTRRQTATCQKPLPPLPSANRTTTTIQPPSEEDLIESQRPPPPQSTRL